MSRIEWPDGKDFAFTVFDDTDRATVDNVGPVYSLLADLGFRTTKSVWPLRGRASSGLAGATCEDERYLTWVDGLRGLGFEIGYHMAKPESSTREETARGLERFVEVFGHHPTAMANHVGCRENIYWGSARLSETRRVLYDLLTLSRRSGRYLGHVEPSAYFWGDLCRDRIRYVRNFVFPGMDTLRACPEMPYHDPARPYVNYWFAASAGSTVFDFTRCISEADQDRLEADGGLCIMYAHFAFGFAESGRPDKRFRSLMERLSRKNGWFAPVSEVLDHLLAVKGPHRITDEERARLERRWLARKVLTGTA